MRAGIPGWLAAAAELAMPLECGGCGRPGVRWCPRCARALHDVPVRLRPRVDPGVPAFAAGRYRGPLRRGIVELKEHRRTDLVPVFGTVLARALIALARWGDLPATGGLVLIPAPTRALAARRRGGDPVTAVSRAAGAELGPRVRVAELLRTAGPARDSAGLDAGGRLANLRGAVVVTGPPPPPVRRRRCTVVLVDDVLTTGATAAVSVAALARCGVAVDAAVVLAGV